MQWDDNGPNNFVSTKNIRSLSAEISFWVPWVCDQTYCRLPHLRPSHSKQPLHPPFFANMFECWINRTHLWYLEELVYVFDYCAFSVSCSADAMHSRCCWDTSNFFHGCKFQKKNLPWYEVLPFLRSDVLTEMLYSLHKGIGKSSEDLIKTSSDHSILTSCRFLVELFCFLHTPSVAARDCQFV